MEKPEKNEEKIDLSAENAENTNFSVSENNLENIEEKTELDKHLEDQGFDFDLGDNLTDDSDFDFDDLDLDDDLEDDEIDLEEDDLDIDEGADPLSDFKDEEQEQPTTISDLKEPVLGDSPKNLENIEKLAEIFITGVDVFKAQMCSKISGEHIAEYLAEDKMKATVIGAIKEYLATQEIKAPTPFGTLMMALAMWTLPPLGVAVWDKYQIGKKKPTIKEKTSTNLNQEEQIIEGEQKTDYSQLKEYQDRRKIFSLNKSKGTYNRTPKGTFIKAEHANEEPSPIVKEWIDSGLTNKEIREQLDYAD